MELLSALAVEAGRVRAVGFRLRVEALAVEIGVARFGAKGRVDLARAGDEAVQLEGEEGAGPGTTPGGLRLGGAGEEGFQGGTANTEGQVGIFGQAFGGLAKGDELAPFERAVVVEAKRNLDPNGKWMGLQRVLAKDWAASGRTIPCLARPSALEPCSKAGFRDRTASSQNRPTAYSASTDDLMSAVRRFSKDRVKAA